MVVEFAELLWQFVCGQGLLCVCECVCVLVGAVLLFCVLGLDCCW